jgi:aspartate/methionine/tyrosine aminotransferase
MESLSVEPFYVMKVLERAKELERKGRKIIHFEVGEPDFPVPQLLKNRAKELIEKVELRYTESAGIPELKERIARHYEETYRVSVSPSRVIVTPGSSPGILAALKVVSERIGRVAYPDPGYPCYKNILKVLKAHGTAVPVTPETAFKVREPKVQAEAIVVNSPSNPTGAVYTAQELSALSERFFLISDEIYHHITFRGRAVSALEVTGDAVVSSGFSKFFLMTGWRVGWLVVPEEMVPEVTAVLQNTVISAPALSQLTALACFEKECMEELKRNVDTLRQRAQLMLKGIREIGFKVPVEPEGAFYIFADASAFTEDSYSFAFELLEKAGVAVTPGVDFGSNQADRFVRFSFCTDTRNIEEGLERLYRYLK